MPNYSIYGLNIYTEKKLKGIPVSKKSTNPDLMIHCSTEVPSSPSHEWELVNIPLSRQRKRIKLWKSTSLADTSIRVRYELTETGTIECTLNHDANELRVYYPERMNENDLTSFLLGTVIGCALRRRQTLCLHASVVSIQGKGVVLMGAKRAGKSTTAAALINNYNADLIADDIAAIKREQGRFSLQAGYSGLRLNLDSMTSIYGDSNESLPKVYSRLPKRYLFLPEKEQSLYSETLNMDVIYLLDKRSKDVKQVSIHTLSQAESVMQLVTNTYANYAVFDRQDIARELALISQLCKTIPIRRIQIPADLDALPQLCEAIIKDSKNSPDAHHVSR